MKNRDTAAGPHLCTPPFTETLPAPVFCRTEHMPAHARYAPMRHPWGEFVYSFSGVTEVKAGAQHYLVPPQQGVWIAPQTEHTGLNHQQTVYCSVYVSLALCATLPAQSCVVLVSPLLRAILTHLRTLPDAADSPERTRLLRVLVDQLAGCATAGSYIPHSADPELDAVLQALREQPADNRSLAQLAAAFHFSERTLMRRCQRELGMSLTEWRQRLRVVRALPRLCAGHSVEAVALDLGYATSSAFIAMFRRLTGSSPARFVARTQ